MLTQARYVPQLEELQRPSLGAGGSGKTMHPVEKLAIATTPWLSERLVAFDIVSPARRLRIQPLHYSPNHGRQNSPRALRAPKLTVL